MSKRRRNNTRKQSSIKSTLPQQPKYILKEDVRVPKNRVVERALDSYASNSDAVTRALGMQGYTVYAGNINAIINTEWRRRQYDAAHYARTNTIAKRYVQVSVDNVVGEGLYASPRVNIFDDEARNKELNRTIEERFWAWAETPKLFDNAGAGDFSIFQQDLERSRAISGEGLVRLHFINGSVRTEVVDPVRLSTTNNLLLDDGFYISNGIEFDSNHRPRAYYLMRFNPVLYQYDPTDFERVPAEEMLHYFVADFPYQERGLSDLTPAIPAMKSLSDYIQAALLQKEISSTTMGFIENSQDNQDGEVLNTSDAVQRYDGYLEPGVLMELHPGKTIKSITPNGATDGIEQFNKEVMKQIAMGLNLSPINLTGDVSGASFAASRLADRMQQNTFRTRTNQLIVDVLKPLYIAWMREESLRLSSEFGFSMKDINKLYAVEFIPRKPASLDPQTDAKTEQILLEMGVKSRRQIILESGRDPEQTFAEIEQEDRLGLNKDATQEVNIEDNKEVTDESKPEEDSQSGE
ncbi:TPA: phage portal protein [Enterobacter mori]